MKCRDLPRTHPERSDFSNVQCSLKKNSATKTEETGVLSTNSEVKTNRVLLEKITIEIRNASRKPTFVVRNKTL